VALTKGGLNVNSDWVQFILNRFIWFIIGPVFVFFALSAEGFLSGTNMINLLLHASVLGLMVIGQAICLISGNFDLSAEGTVSLLAMLAAWMMVPEQAWSGGGGWEVHPLIVIPVILLLGAFIGLFNGFLITQLGMNNFIVTLAMQLVLRGLALMLNKGNYISGTPDLFNWLGEGRISQTHALIVIGVLAVVGLHLYYRNSSFGQRMYARGPAGIAAAYLGGGIFAFAAIWALLGWIGDIPVQIIFTGIAFVGFHYYLTNSRFGRQLYAVGGNKEAARASGFSPKRTITTAYVISGVLAAIAAWMLLGRIGEATDKTGVNLTLETVAASVIGGVALSGGYGSVLGALSGVMLLSIVDNGLNLMQVNPFWVNGIRGTIILAAIFVEAQKFRFKPRAARSREST